MKRGMCRWLGLRSVAHSVKKNSHTRENVCAVGTVTGFWMGSAADVLVGVVFLLFQWRKLCHADGTLSLLLSQLQWHQHSIVGNVGKWTWTRKSQDFITKQVSDTDTNIRSSARTNGVENILIGNELQHLVSAVTPPPPRSNKQHRETNKQTNKKAWESCKRKTKYCCFMFLKQTNV